MNEDLGKEIGEMNKVFGESSNESQDQDDNKIEDNHKDDVDNSINEGNVVDDKELDNKEGASEDVSVDVKGSEDKENDTEVIVDDRDTTIETLRTRVAELEANKVKDDEPKDVKKDNEPEESKPLTFEDQDFIGDLELDDLIRDPKEFNKLLNTIYQKAVTDTRKVLGEGVLRSIPDIVKSNISTMTMLKEASEKFYNDNEDLKPFKKVVAAVFEDISSQNPDKRFDEILNSVGDEVRKRLDLKKTAVKGSVAAEERSPRLPRNKGRSGGPNDTKPDTSPLQNDIAKMNETLRR